MPSRLNQLLYQELTERLREVAHGIFVDYTGLSAMEANELRGRLLKDALRLHVIKNQIARLALRDAAGVKGLEELLLGPIAVVYGNDDPVAAAKTILDCMKGIGKLEIRGGFLDGAALTAADVENLARMPSKKDLFGHLLAAITAPASNIAGCLDGIFRELNFGGLAAELAGLFDAFHEKLKEGAEA